MPDPTSCEKATVSARVSGKTVDNPAGRRVQIEPPTSTLRPGGLHQNTHITLLVSHPVGTSAFEHLHRE